LKNAINYIIMSELPLLEYAPQTPEQLTYQLYSAVGNLVLASKAIVGGDRSWFPIYGPSTQPRQDFDSRFNLSEAGEPHSPAYYIAYNRYSPNRARGAELLDIPQRIRVADGEAPWIAHVGRYYRGDPDSLPIAKLRIYLEQMQGARVLSPHEIAARNGKIYNTHTPRYAAHLAFNRLFGGS
jgi:hypothetical protein